MKKLVLIVILLVQGAYAQQTDIKNTIGTFFEGLHAGDTVRIKSVCSDKLILQSVIEGPMGSRLEHEDISKFYKSIASIPAGMKIEERLLDYRIQTDGSMAHVWTPYEFYINGKMSHSGVNSFQLYKDNGTWKIIYIVDTRRVKQN